LRRGHHLFQRHVLRVQVPATLPALFSDEPALYPDAEKCSLVGNRCSALWANDSLKHKRYNEDQRQEWDSEPIGQVQGQQANRELNDHDTSPRQLILPIDGHNLHSGIPRIRQMSLIDPEPSSVRVCFAVPDPAIRSNR
jgi:hypothetical protein